MTQADTLEKIMANESRAYSNTLMNAPSSPRVICVTSGKGGVGKTNVATNLAYFLAVTGKKVLILDADLNLANIDVLLGLSPRYNINHVLKGEKHLQEIIVQGPGGISILPASSGIMELATMTEKQKLFFLSEMETIGQTLDYLIIDTAAGINDNVVYFNLTAQERIIVLTPEPTSLTDAYALIKVLASRHGVKRFRVLVNQATTDKEGKSVFRKLSDVADRFLDTISLDFLGFVPSDKHLPKAVRQQRLVSDIYPDSPSGRSFARLSEDISGETPEYSSDGNIKFFWKGIVDL